MKKRNKYDSVARDENETVRNKILIKVEWFLGICVVK